MNLSVVIKIILDNVIRTLFKLTRWRWTTFRLIVWVWAGGFLARMHFIFLHHPSFLLFCFFFLIYCMLNRKLETVSIIWRLIQTNKHAGNWDTNRTHNFSQICFCEFLTSRSLPIYFNFPPFKFCKQKVKHLTLAPGETLVSSDVPSPFMYKLQHDN